MCHRFVIVAFLLASTSSAVRAADQFKPFTSSEGKFTVLMPGTPKEQKDVTKAGGLDITTRMFVCEVDANRAIIVSFNDIPAPGVNAGNIDKIMDAAENAYNRTAKGTVLSSKKITLGKHPGREVLIKLPGDKGLVKVDIYLVGDRLYQVLGIGPESFIRSMQLDRYYQSFKVNE